MGNLYASLITASAKQEFPLGHTVDIDNHPTYGKCQVRYMYNAESSSSLSAGAPVAFKTNPTTGKTMPGLGIRPTGISSPLAGIALATIPAGQYGWILAKGYYQAIPVESIAATVIIAHGAVLYGNDEKFRPLRGANAAAGMGYVATLSSSTTVPIDFPMGYVLALEGATLTGTVWTIKGYVIGVL